MRFNYFDFVYKRVGFVVDFLTDFGEISPFSGSIYCMQKLRKPALLVHEIDGVPDLNHLVKRFGIIFVVKFDLTILLFRAKFLFKDTNSTTF